MQANYKVNGLDVKGLDGIIAVTKGYSIGDDLGAKGYKMDTTASKSTINFKKLLAGRVKYVAEFTPSGDAIMF
jgi:hypothetical protein